MKILSRKRFTKPRVRFKRKPYCFRLESGLVETAKAMGVNVNTFIEDALHNLIVHNGAKNSILGVTVRVKWPQHKENGSIDIEPTNEPIESSGKKSLK